MSQSEAENAVDAGMESASRAGPGWSVAAIVTDTVGSAVKCFRFFFSTDLPHLKVYHIARVVGARAPVREVYLFNLVCRCVGTAGMNVIEFGSAKCIVSRTTQLEKYQGETRM